MAAHASDRMIEVHPDNLTTFTFSLHVKDIIVQVCRPHTLKTNIISTDYTFTNKSGNKTGSFGTPLKNDTRVLRKCLVWSYDERHYVSSRLRVKGYSRVKFLLALLPLASLDISGSITSPSVAKAGISTPTLLILAGKRCRKL